MAEHCKASPGVSEDVPYNKPSDEDLNDALQHNSSDDTLGLQNGPKHSNGENSENEPLDDTADDSLADNLASSLPISNSKLKSDDESYQSQKIPWYLWWVYTGRQVGGWTEVYEGVTFASVRGAEHEVPLIQSRRAFMLFKFFLVDKSLTKA